MEKFVSLDFYVLIPCYNDQEGLLRSLKSIHYDTAKFAVLIVDDGSEIAVQHAHLLPFISSVIERAGMYPEQFPHAEDYGFFYSVINHGKGAILPEKLVTCAIRQSGISWQFRKEQLISRRKVVWFYGNNKLLAALGILKLW